MSTLDARNQFAISLNGKKYEIDFSRYRRQTIEATRAQQDQSSEAAEQTLNNQYLWKRTADAFDFGAGQKWFDFDQTTSRRQFDKSLHVNVWEDKQISLLKEATQRVTTNTTYGAANVWLVNFGNLLFRFQNYRNTSTGVPESFTIQYVNSPTASSWTFTNLSSNTGGIGGSSVAFKTGSTGTTLAAGEYITSLVADGNTVYWTGSNTNYVHSWQYEDATGLIDAQQIGSNHEFRDLMLVGGRLLATHNDGTNVELVEIGASTKTVIAQYPVRTYAQFTSATAGPDGFFFGQAQVGRTTKAGQENVSSWISKSTIKEDGTINPPQPIAELPEGEVVTALFDYSGYILIGTSKGFRLGEYTATGGIRYGRLIQTVPEDATPLWKYEDSGDFTKFNIGVRKFEAEGRYVWFNWDHYKDYTTLNADGHQGLGRIDLGQLVDELVPAYATDLMVNRNSNSTVETICQYNNKLYFGTTHNGHWGETTNYKSIGYLNTGRITFGTGETKQFARLDTNTTTVAGGTDNIDISVTSSNNSTPTIGQIGAGSNNNSLVLTDHSGEYAEISFVLNSSTNQSVTPYLTQWTMRAIPVPERQEEIFLPIILKSKVGTNFGSTVGLNPYSEFSDILALLQSRTIVPLIMGDEELSVIVDSVITGSDATVKLENWDNTHSFPQGIWYVRCITIAQDAPVAVPTIFLRRPVLLTGSGAPSDLIGVNGDVYIDTTNDILYGPKANDVWPTPGDNLVGAQGATGPQGSTGPQGATGPQGDDSIEISPTPPSNTDILWVDTSATSTAGVTGPTGSVIAYAGDTAPSGWLLCHGQSVAVSSFPALYAVIQYTYGGSGANFNLPDLRGRVIAGQDDMGGTSANRLTNQSGGLDGDTLGASGGSETHTLSESQLPSHSHGVGSYATATAGDHYHDVQFENRGTAAGTSFLSGIQEGSGTSDGLTQNAGSHTHTITGSSGTTGSGAAHNNVQPTIILNYIIKT